MTDEALVTLLVGDAVCLGYKDDRFFGAKRWNHNDLPRSGVQACHVQ